MAHPIENFVCPECGSKRGEPCRDMNGSTVRPHQAAIDEWAKDWPDHPRHPDNIAKAAGGGAQ